VPQEQTASDFYISYTGADTAWAEWIASVLESAGYVTVLQSRDFRPGDAFVERMHQEIERAARVMPILSGAYLASRFGEAEWRAAFAKDPSGEKGLLVPVRVEECDPPGLLRGLIYIDLVGLDEATARERLLAGVGSGQRPDRQAHFPGMATVRDRNAAPRSPGGTTRRVRKPAPQFPGTFRHQVEWLSDAPAATDLLRRRPLAQTLATRLRRIHDEEPTTSFLIHIDGPWGTGKSSLLEFLDTELERDWLTVKFDAWRQARIGPPWWALLAALRHDLGHNIGLLARTRLRIAETLARLRRAGAPFVLALTFLLAAATGIFLLLRPSVLTLKSAGDLARTVTAILAAAGTLWAGALVAGRFLLWDSARGARLFEQSNTNPMQDVTDHFGWLVARVERPILFLIDDLDRCPEGYVVELLDAVQTLIRDAPRRRADDGMTGATYFVVAADGAWIRKSYEVAYEKFAQSVAEPGRPLGYLFLDKLFQLRVPIPAIDAQRQNTYLRELLGMGGMGRAATQDSTQEVRAVTDTLERSSTESQVIEALRKASPEVRDRVAGVAVKQLTTPEVSAATEHSLQRFGSLLPPNPRSMKRFVNAYSILRAVRTLEGNTVESEPLALWTILEIRWPALADYLRSNPETIELLYKSVNDVNSISDELQVLLTAPEVRQVADFEWGGPLTADLVRACCGAATSSGPSIEA
jgi:TIR domain/KAP family P-loop domain